MLLMVHQPGMDIEQTWGRSQNLEHRFQKGRRPP